MQLPQMSFEKSSCLLYPYFEKELKKDNPSIELLPIRIFGNLSGRESQVGNFYRFISLVMQGNKHTLSYVLACCYLVFFFSFLFLCR